MKRSALIVFILLFAVSSSGLAQQSNVAEAVYNKWRQEAPADEVSKVRFALASVTQRTGDDGAEVELWAVGWTSRSVFKIRPLHFEKLPNDEFKQEQTGGITEVTVGSSDGGSQAGDKIRLKIIVPVTPNTNEIEIQWIGDVGGRRQIGTVSTVLLLRDKPSENLTTMTGD